MESSAHPFAGQHLRNLAGHARSLQREAHAALKLGDCERAEALIDSAQMLVSEVGSLVDEMEARQTQDYLRLLADEQATMDRFSIRKPAAAKPLINRLQRIGPAIGLGLAVGFALVEC